jgi:hypothetical protein
MPHITESFSRIIRRRAIEYYLKSWGSNDRISQQSIKSHVRSFERINYGREMKSY